MAFLISAKGFLTSLSAGRIAAKLDLNKKINEVISLPSSFEIKKKLTMSDRFALGIATGGVGYMPIVPATWGSLVGVGIFLLARHAGGSLATWAHEHQISPILLNSAIASLTLIFLIGLFIVGIWAATRVERLTGKKDPGIVVVDEILGQFIAFLFIPAGFGWWMIAAGFLAFRVFDVLKPYPTGKFETLPSGLGVMADDVMAGFYAALTIASAGALYSIAAHFL